MATNCENCEKELTAQGFEALCLACQKRCDALLAYCQSSLQNHAVKEVSKAIEIHFSSQHVVASRQLLRDYWSEHLEGLSVMGTEYRRNSDTRSAQQANAWDITVAVNQLMKLQKPPRFVAWDLYQLPIVRPKTSETDLDEKLILLENTL